MKELYFSFRTKKSIRAVRLEFGKFGEKFILKTFEGEENNKGLFIYNYIFPREELFISEQEMNNKVYETKNGLLESRWVIQNKKISSHSEFIKTEIIDGDISLEL